MDSRLRLAIAESHIASWDWNPSTGEVTASPFLAALLGVHWSQDFEGKVADFVHPDDIAGRNAHVSQAIARGTGWRAEFRIVRPRDGEITWLEERAVATVDLASGALQFTVLTWEITKRKRLLDQFEETANLLEFLVSLNDTLRGLDDPVKIKETTARMLSTRLETDGALYSELNANGMAEIIEAGYLRTAGPPIRLAVGEDGKSAIDRFFSDKTIAIDDLQRQPGLSAVDRTAYAGLNLRAIACAPVMRDGHPHMWLILFHRSAHVWTSQEIAHLESAAARSSEAVDRAQAEAALRASEANNRFLVALGDVLRALDDVVRIRDAVTRLLGRHLDVQRVIFVEVDPVGETAAVTSEYRSAGVPKNPKRVRLADFGTFVQLRGKVGDDLVVDDVNKLRDISDATLEVYKSFRIGGFIAIAINTPGRAPAYLVIHSLLPRAWRPSDVELVRNVAERAHEALERAQATNDLRESEDRLRTLVEGIPQLVWRCDQSGQWSWSSPQWQVFTGLSPGKSEGLGWLSAVHPQDRPEALAAWRPEESSTGYHAEFRIYDAAHERYCWFRTRATPVRNESGGLVEFLGTSTYVDDIHELQGQQRALLAELQHRVRNTLSIVRSIARRTAETSETVEAYAMHLEGRIEALARVQAVVTRNPATGVDLASIIADELSAYGAREGEGLLIDGPPVRLRPKPAEAFTLAIHELTTNAIKYGALSFTGARLDVTWSLEGEGETPQLVVKWNESGIPVPIAPPSRSGFGTDLLRRSLSYDLDAIVQQSFEPDGMKVTIDIPHIDRLMVPVDAPRGSAEPLFTANP